MLLFLLAACSETGLSSYNDANQSEHQTPPMNQTHDSGATGDDTGQDTGTPNDPADTGTPQVDDPPTGSPPEIWLNDCPEQGVSVDFDPGEIYVLAGSPSTETGTLTSSHRGWFHVFDTTIAESGASQQNESGFVRISNSGNPDGAPRWSTCGDDWIVRDADNHGTPKAEKLYLGTFWIEQGDNDLRLEHLCNLVNAGECASEMNQVSGHMCGDSNANSVHLLAEGMCVIRAR